MINLPTILQGVASVINIRGECLEDFYTISDESADRVAMESDWNAVENDIKITMKEIFYDTK